MRVLDDLDLRFVDEADNIRTDPNTFFTFLVKRLPLRVNAKIILLFQ